MRERGSSMQRRGSRMAAWLTLGVALLLPPRVAGVAPVRSGDDRERIMNDQSQLFDRLSSLRKRMERLAGKLDAEGKVHQAGLLRKAIAEVDARNLESRKDQLLELLGDSRNLQAPEQQENLLKDLSAVLELLLDRPALDELDERLEELKQSLADVAALRDEQRRVREATEQVSNDPARRQEQLAQEITEALRKQQALRQETAQSARQRPANAAERERDAAEQAALEQQLGQLVEQQRQVVDALAQREREQVGSTPTALRQARTATQRGDRAAQEEAARRLEEARSELPEPSAALSEALRTAEAALREAAKAPAEGDSDEPSAARKAAEAALQRAEAAVAAERQGADAAETAAARAA
ncbi:MAG: hypothetical protein FJ293_13895, partial [Planctomycetes bacterium]|nr:hypothetical protein [Planctomycetota bacterium]